MVGKSLLIGCDVDGTTAAAAFLLASALLTPNADHTVRDRESSPGLQDNRHLEIGCLGYFRQCITEYEHCSYSFNGARSS